MATRKPPGNPVKRLAKPQIKPRQPLKANAPAQSTAQQINPNQQIARDIYRQLMQLQMDNYAARENAFGYPSYEEAGIPLGDRKILDAEMAKMRANIDTQNAANIGAKNAGDIYNRLMQDQMANYAAQYGNLVGSIAQPSKQDISTQYGNLVKSISRPNQSVAQNFANVATGMAGLTQPGMQSPAARPATQKQLPQRPGFNTQGFNPPIRAF